MNGLPTYTGICAVAVSRCSAVSDFFHRTPMTIDASPKAVDCFAWLVDAVQGAAEVAQYSTEAAQRTAEHATPKPVGIKNVIALAVLTHSYLAADAQATVLPVAASSRASPDPNLSSESRRR